MASEGCDKLKLKLLIDKKSQKVLFAEAGKGAVDFLSSLLVLPVRSLIKLITTESMVGSLGCTLASLEQLDNDYYLSTDKKTNLVRSSIHDKTPLCIYCSQYNGCVFHGFPCRACYPAVAAERSMKGYVKASVTYSLMDDLSVVPLSPTSTIALLNKLGLNDFSLLEERTVYLTADEGLELVKASLLSKNVLTAVFLAKKKGDLKAETN